MTNQKYHGVSSGVEMQGQPHEQHIEFPEDNNTNGGPQDDSSCWGFLQKTEFFSRCLNKTIKTESRRGYGELLGLLPSGDGDIGAGHVGRYISLANPDRLSRAMCCLPLALLITILICCVFTIAFWSTGFWIIFAFCNIHVMFMGLHFAFGTLYGVTKMRRAVAQNWGRLWEDFMLKHPGIDEGMLHIVILPNYKEDEQMMSETVTNLAESDMAQKHMVVVLAMEAREGENGKQKADRLIHRHKGQFKHMYATYHPANIPCEVAGKSSNSQWAFREVQRWYGNYVSQSDDVHDSTKVFLTVADADSLVHRDYFCNLSIAGLSLPESERTWSVWQAPALCLRNYETIPILTRCAAYGCLLYEISGLATAHWQHHPCFSAYSITLAMANHPMVDGWDADVIAEDHHMFLKCMFASYWEEIFSTKSVTAPSKILNRPIWLPTTSYSAEDSSNDGWFQSSMVRFQQARRHSQGVAELSYLVLQYVTIMMEHSMPWKAHFEIWGIFLKFMNIHIFTALHGALGVAVSAYCSVWAATNLINGQLEEKVVDVAQDAVAVDDKPYCLTFNMTLALWSFAVIFPVLGGLFGLAQWMVVKDNVEGRYCPLYLQSVCDPERANKKTHKLSLKESIKLFVHTTSDTVTLGNLTSLIICAIPVMMASVSMYLHGHKFDYVVAGKPEGNRAKKNISGTEPEELQVLANEARV